MLYGRQMCGHITKLTPEQQKEREGEPVVVLVEKDNRTTFDAELKYAHNRYRAIVAMFISDDIMIANGKGHGPNKEEAINRAKKRCKESLLRGILPFKVSTFANKIKK